MSDDFIFTSESVTRGHPDKLADQVSDAIVDRFLDQDPHARIVAECAVSSGVLFVSTHFASEARLDIAEAARNVIRSIGYPRHVFDADACTILTSLKDHSVHDYHPMDLDSMHDAAIDNVLCRQQASVFGYACDQTPDLLPMPVWLAHRIAARLDSPKVRKKLPYLLPDNEVQVGVEYEKGLAQRIQSVNVVATQTEESGVDLDTLYNDIVEHVISQVLNEVELPVKKQCRVHINPGGLRIGGGPALHSGLTGRKTGIDTYGEYARHSGSALSGKDPMRIDRVGAYIGRYAAKNVVASGLARECEVQLSYSIGLAGPVSLRVRTFGSGEVDDAEIADRLRSSIDFRLGGIVRTLKLKSLSKAAEGFFELLAVYGHMGRHDLDVPWERTDLADALK